MDVGDLVAKLKVDRKGVGPALAATEAEAEAAGGRAGGKFGDGFRRNSEGRLINGLGRYVSESDRAGGEGGSRFSAGFVKGLLPASKSVDKFADKLKSVGKVTAIMGAGGSAIALGGAIAQVSGALLAVPAAGGMAASVLGTLKLGTSGLGDAMSALADGDAKKIAKAMENLSPAGQAAARGFDAVRKSYGGVKSAVQTTLLAGLVGEAQQLGATYLPIMQRGLTSNASALNSWAMSASAAAKSPFVSGAVGQIMDVTAAAMARNAPIAGNLVTIFAALGGAGARLMGGALDTVSGFLATKAAFLSSAEGAAWLEAKMRLAGTILTALGAVVVNVGKLIGSMFTAGVSTGSQLLGTLVRLTAGAAQWAASAQGQQQLADLFKVLGEVLNNLLVILPPISGAFMALASFVAGLPAPVQGAVTGFMSFALVAGMLLPKIIGLVGGILKIGGALATGASSIVMAAARWGLMGTAAQTAAASQNASVLAIIGGWLRMAAAATINAVKTAGAWLLTTGANAATAVASMVSSVAVFLAQWAIMAARSVASALVTAGAWLLTTGAAAATAIGTMIATVAVYLAQWVIMAAGAMASAIATAAAWFVALGPVGWVIAAIVGLVALVIANWDTVKAWTIAAWSAVSAAVAAAWNAIVSWVTGAAAAVVGFVTSAWNNVVNAARAAWSACVAAVSAGISAVIGFVSALPGRILSALSSLGSLLVGLGGDLVRGLWNGISAGWSWLTGMVSGLAHRLLDAAKSALGIGSPSKLFRDEVGRWLPAGMAVGIRADGKQVADAVTAVSRDASAGLTARAIGGNRPGGGPASSGDRLEELVGHLTDAVDAARAVSDRPVQLDGKAVTKGVTRRQRVERRLVSPDRR